jgi:hypothetical protein
MCRYTLPLVILLAAAIVPPSNATPTVKGEPVATSSNHVAKLIQHRRTNALRAIPRVVRGHLAASIQAAGLKLKSRDVTRNSGPSDVELNLVCNDDWFIMYEEKDGHPVLGTFELYCAGQVIPIG